MKHLKFLGALFVSLVLSTAFVILTVSFLTGCDDLSRIKAEKRLKQKLVQEEMARQQQETLLLQQKQYAEAQQRNDAQLAALSKAISQGLITLPFEQYKAFGQWKIDWHNSFYDNGNYHLYRSIDLDFSLLNKSQYAISEITVLIKAFGRDNELLMEEEKSIDIVKETGYTLKAYNNTAMFMLSTSEIDEMTSKKIRTVTVTLIRAK